MGAAVEIYKKILDVRIYHCNNNQNSSSNSKTKTKFKLWIITKRLLFLVRTCSLSLICWKHKAAPFDELVGYLWYIEVKNLMMFCHEINNLNFAVDKIEHQAFVRNLISYRMEGNFDVLDPSMKNWIVSETSYTNIITL